MRFGRLLIEKKIIGRELTAGLLGDFLGEALVDVVEWGAAAVVRDHPPDHRGLGLAGGHTGGRAHEHRENGEFYSLP